MLFVLGLTVVVIIAWVALRNVIAAPLGWIMKLCNVDDPIGTSRRYVTVAGRAIGAFASICGIVLLWPHVAPMFSALGQAFGNLFIAFAKLSGP